MNALQKSVIRISAIALFTLIGVRSVCADDMILAGMLDFQRVDIHQALKVYKDLTGFTLFVDSRVERCRTEIVCKNEKPISKHDAAKLIENALLEQAAVVVTKLDSNRVSVTFNDSLPVKVVERK
jgi:hypothetical protein